MTTVEEYKKEICAFARQIIDEGDLDNLHDRLSTLETKVREDERNKVLELLVDEKLPPKSDPNVLIKWLSMFQKVVARNNLRAELRQQIKELA
jgi:hypothetical protein